MKPWSPYTSPSALKRSFESMIERYGHWVLYRRYNVGEKSEHYRPNTGDSVGGPKWTFEDKPTKLRHDPMSVRGAVGIGVQTSKMFVKADIHPKRGDVIIELDYEPTENEPTEYKLYFADHVEAFEIMEIDPKRGFRGKIEYYIVQVTPHMGDY